MRHTVPAKIRSSATPGARFWLMLVLLALTSMLCAPIHAQQTASEALDDDIEAVLDDGWSIFSAPAHFDTRDWILTALTAGAAAAAYVIDDDVRSEVRGFAGEGWNTPLTIGEWYGSGVVSGGLGVGLIAASALTGDDDTRITGRMVLQSLVYSITITEALKIITGRARPETGENKSAFHFLRTDVPHHSFPSGHTTAAFALSSTLSRRVGSTPLSIVLYGLSMLTVLERIADDKHWFSDTVVGAVIGSVVGLAVVQLEEEREREDAPILSQRQPFHRPLFQYQITF